MMLMLLWGFRPFTLRDAVLALNFPPFVYRVVAAAACCAANRVALVLAITQKRAPELGALINFGGDACESNTPETFCAPHYGFEGRGAHQDPPISIEILVVTRPSLSNFPNLNVLCNLAGNISAKGHFCRRLSDQFACVADAARDALRVEMLQQRYGEFAAGAHGVLQVGGACRAVRQLRAQ